MAQRFPPYVRNTVILVNIPQATLLKLMKKRYLIMMFFLQVFRANHLVLSDKKRDLKIRAVLFSLTLQEFLLQRSPKLLFWKM